MDWKRIIEKVIVAVTTGVILGAGGWAASRFFAPNPPVSTKATHEPGMMSPMQSNKTNSPAVPK
jgi:hypothetical protein